MTPILMHSSTPILLHTFIRPTVQGMTYLGKTIAQVPDKSLASKKEVLQLLHGQFGGEAGSIRGIGRAGGGWDQPWIHCPRKPCGDYACDEPAGCVAKGEKCFVFRVKETWVTARFPKIKDKYILKKIKDLQAEFTNHCKKKHSDAFVADIAKTFNLAPKKYRETVMENVEEEEERLRILRILDDYVGPSATRYLS